MNGFFIGLFLGILLGLAIPPFYKWIVSVVTKKDTPVSNAKAIITLPLIALGLSSCGKFHGTNQSIWSDGMWLVPLLLFLASALFFLFAFKASKSKSHQQGPRGYTNYEENTPIYKTGQFWFSVAFFLVAIGVIIWQNAEK